MLMPWLFVASLFSLPVETIGPLHDVRAIFSANDFPAYVQIAGINRFVATRTTVRPDGTVQDCSVEGGSGDPQLDAYTCGIIMRRARFTPAKWIDESPTYGVIRVPVTWAIGGQPSKRETAEAYPGDLELTVTRLPKGADRQTGLRLMIAVDETGRVLDCSELPDPPRGDNTRKFPELVPIACEHLLKEYVAVPAKDATGKAVRSIQTATVRFSVGS